ncbi:MAG: BON domain-containing protein [Pyrinomonadaceae bacterium]|nr:BON domain-containing protein [Pyrinomonadaceae bacterium]MBP6212541.1 BON domain-containing protein [Pyrinomonadaceae bacterium]
MIRTNMKFFIGFFVFALLISVGAALQPVSAQCEKVTDQQIVFSIYAKIKNDKDLASQVTHINIVSINSAVKLQGWADNKNDFDSIVDIAMDTICVRVVNLNNFLDAPPAADNAFRSAKGCASGTKACGDVCIPEGDVCNIGSLAALFVPTYRPDVWNDVSSISAVAACW